MPMSGIKVVEACSNIAGPVTGTIFGDLGAEVIKIEKPNGGDDARGWSPPVIHGMGARFQAINRNKLSVTLELKNAKDRDELKRLVAEADVFVHNMRPGVAESLGVTVGKMVGGLGQDPVAQAAPDADRRELASDSSR